MAQTHARTTREHASRPSPPPAPLILGFVAVWQRLTRPAASIREPEQRRRAELLASLLLPLIPFSLLASITLPILIDPHFRWLNNPDPWIGLLATLALVLAYRFSRSEHFRRGTLLTVLIASLTVWIASLQKCDDSSGCGALFFLPISVLLSSILLSLRFTLILAVLNSLGILMLPVLDRAVSLPTTIVPFAASSLVSILIGMAMTLRDQDLFQIDAQSRDLRESERCYRDLFANNPHPMWVYDLATLSFLDVNTAAIKHYGYTRGEFLEMTLKDIRPAEDIPDLLKDVAETKAGHNLAGAWHHRKKNGAIIDVEIVSHDLTFDGRKARAVLVNDITDRQRAEQALRRTNRALRMLSTVNQVMVKAADESELLEEICRAIVQVGGHRMAWIGFAENDAVKTVRPMVWAGEGSDHIDSLEDTWVDAVHRRGPAGTAIRTGQPFVARDTVTEPAFASWRTHAIEHGFASAIALPLVVDSHPMGALNIYSAESDAFDDEEVQLLNETTSDLAYGIATLRTRGERRKSEERLQTIMDSMLEGCQIISFDWRYLYVNDAVAAQGKQLKEKLLGHTMMEVYPGFEKSELFTTLQSCMDQRTPQRLENEFDFPDGSKGWFELSIQPVPEGIFILSMDITERKRAEVQIRQTAARAEALARTAARLNAQLDLKTVLSLVCEEAARALDVPAAFINLYNAQRDTLDFSASCGLPGDFGERYQSPGRALYEDYSQRLGPLVVIPDVQRLADIPNTELYAALNVRTVANARMQRNGTLIGVLSVLTLAQTRPFANDDLSLLQGIAEQATLAISNARHFEQQQARRGELSSLYDLSRQLADLNEFGAILDLIPHRLVETIPVTFARLALVEDEHLVIRAAYPLRFLGLNLEIGRRELLSALPLYQRVLSQNDPVILDAAGAEMNELEREVSLLDRIKSLCLVPLRVGEQALGILLLEEACALAREPFTQEKLRLARSIGEQATSALHRARLNQQTQKHLQRLAALHEIDVAITSSTDLRLTLNTVLEEVRRQLGVDACAVLLLDPTSRLLEYVASRGFRTARFSQSQLRLGEGIAGRAALERRRIDIPNLAEVSEHFAQASLVEGEGFVSFYALPLIAKEEVKGVLDIFHRSRLNPDSDWLNFMESLAGQTAIAIDNAELFDGLQRSNLELSEAYDSTLEGWSRALDLRDKETEGHTQRVTEMTVQLARVAGMRGEELLHVRRGGLLHDIGKMGIPDSILLKPGPLTDAEWVIMRQHPELAYQLLSSIRYLRPALDIPYCHHEKWDGTGYPRGLKGKQIPLAARLFAVVDVWDALRSDRPYREGWPEAKVVDHLRQQAGTHFEPQVVETFLELLQSKS